MTYGSGWASVAVMCLAVWVEARAAPAVTTELSGRVSYECDEPACFRARRYRPGNMPSCRRLASRLCR
jgi:hypothetical protein